MRTYLVIRLADGGRPPMEFGEHPAGFEEEAVEAALAANGSKEGGRFVAVNLEDILVAVSAGFTVQSQRSIRLAAEKRAAGTPEPEPVGVDD